MKRMRLVFLGDFLSFWVSFIFILLLRYGGSSFNEQALKHFLPFIVLYVSWILIFYLFGLYDLYTIKPTIAHLKRYGLAVILSFIVGIFLFYFAPIFGISPKTNLIFQIIGFGLLSLSLRRITYNIYASQIVRPTILVGETPYIQELNKIINNNPQIGLNVISCTNDLHKALKDYSHLNNSVFIFESITNNIPDKDIITLYANKTEIIDITKAYEKYIFKIPIGYISQSWIVENISTKKDIFYSLYTRVFDIVFALCVLIFLSPILILAIIARLIEDGKPVFIKQQRIGENGKIFKLFKIRSMIVLSKDGSAETNKVEWAKKDDYRITPLGYILRKTHIDEIPQMINILKGNITLVGPRPERPEFVKILEQDIPNYRLRHIIKPGFTGWAQIKYRYANTIKDQKEKFEYDLYYIKNRNIFLDFGIILRTIQIIFTH